MKSLTSLNRRKLKATKAQADENSHPNSAPRPSLAPERRTSTVSASHHFRKTHEWTKKQERDAIVVRVFDPHYMKRRNSLEKLTRKLASTSTSQSTTSASSHSSSLLSTSSLAYLVQTSEGDADAKIVERTYMEFVSLRDVLRTRFPNRCLAPLPPPGTLLSRRSRNANDHFVKKRMRMLELFLQAVGEDAFYKNDDAFLNFITSPSRFSDVVRNLAEYGTRPSVGQSMWAEALKEAPKPLDATKLLKSVQDELALFEKSLKNVKAAVKDEILKTSARTKSFKELTTSIEQWQLVEYNAISPLNGTVEVDVPAAPLMQDGEEFQGSKRYLENKRRASTSSELDLSSGANKTISLELDVVQVLKELAANSQEHAQLLSNDYGDHQLESVFLDSLRFEIAYVKRWSEAVVEAQGVLKAHAKSKRLIAEAQVSLETAQRSNNSGDASAVEHKLREARAAEKRARADAEQMEKALLCMDLSRMRRSRTVRATKLFDAVADMHIRGAKCILRTWGTELDVATLRKGSSSSAISSRSSSTASSTNSIASSVLSPLASVRSQAEITRKRAFSFSSSKTQLPPPPPLLSDIHKRRKSNFLTELKKKNPTNATTSTAKDLAHARNKSLIETFAITGLMALCQLLFAVSYLSQGKLFGSIPFLFSAALSAGCGYGSFRLKTMGFDFDVHTGMALLAETAGPSPPASSALGAGSTRPPPFQFQHSKKRVFRGSHLARTSSLGRRESSVKTDDDEDVGGSDEALTPRSKRLKSLKQNVCGRVVPSNDTPTRPLRPPPSSASRRRSRGRSVFREDSSHIM